MEYVYSALLLHSAKQPINEENMKKVLQSIGITPDDAKVKALIASLEGVNIDEVLQQAVMVAPKAEEKKEEEKEEEKVPEAAAGLSALFG